MREWMEYAATWMGLKSLGLLPRPVARLVGESFAAIAYALRPPLRRAAMFNLSLAFPDWTEAHRKGVMRRMVQQIGWMAAEFSQFPKYTRANIENIVVLDGFENFDLARRRRKGVLFLTGHMSAWELAPFAHALYSHPLHFLVRPIANRRVDALINRYRCLSGNQPIEKNKSARPILRILADGGTVGILSDHNTVLEESVFVDFFGIPASTTSGLARIASEPMPRWSPGFFPGIAYAENIVYVSNPPLSFRAPKTRSKTSAKIPRASQKLSKIMCTQILTSGFGCTKGGRRVRQVKKKSTLRSRSSLPLTFN